MGFGLHIGDYMFELDASEHLLFLLVLFLNQYETFVYGTLLKIFLIHTLSVNEP